MSRRESVQIMAAISDWPTQLAVLKVMFNCDDLNVKYIDDENEEVKIETQNDYEFANQIAISATNSVLRLVLRNSRDEIIGKLNLHVDLIKSGTSESLNMTSSSVESSSMRSSSTSGIERIAPPQPPPPSSNESSTTTSRLLSAASATLSSTTRSSNSSNSMNKQATAPPQPVPPFTPAQVQWLEAYLGRFKAELLKEMLLPSEERRLPDVDLITFDAAESPLSLETRVQRLYAAIFEARLNKRNMRAAYLEEELQSTGAFMAEFIKDENMPDGSRCEPGVRFEKTWLIKNVGKLEWCEDKYPVRLVCIAGNIMAENDVDCGVVVPETGVEATASVSVTLVAPSHAGTYFSEWVLCCNGFKFGPRIWCTIEVTGDASNSESKDLSLSESMYSEQTARMSQSRQQSSGNHQQQQGEDVDDEFVVIPDCFDLDKKWRVNKHIQKQHEQQQLQNDLDKKSNTELDYHIDDDDDDDDTSLLNKTNTLLHLTGEELVTRDAKTDVTEEKHPRGEDAINTSRVATNKSSLESSIERISGSDSTNDCEVVKRGDEFVLSRLIGEKLSVSETRDPDIDDTNTTDEDKNKSTPLSTIETNTQQQQQPTNETSPSSSNHLNHVNSNISQAFGAMKDALSNLGRPSYVGSIQLGGETNEESPEAKMKKLIQMGFADRRLNQRLLNNHNYDLDKVVQNLLEINDNDWASNR